MMLNIICPDSLEVTERQIQALQTIIPDSVLLLLIVALGYIFTEEAYENAVRNIEKGPEGGNLTRPKENYID